ncbi:MAG: hypothetical protein ABI045_05150 [Flavobacteriales bacterium]
MSSLKDKHLKGVFYSLQIFSREKNIDPSQIHFLIETEEEKNLVLLKKHRQEDLWEYHTANSAQHAQIYI